jgi:alanine dehydrogenase
MVRYVSNDLTITVLPLWCWLFLFLLPARGERVSLRALCLVRELLGQVSPLGDAIFAVHGLGTHPIVIAGSPDQRGLLDLAARGDAVFAFAEMIVKVKEPQAVEVARLKPHQILFTYLHLAADVPQTRGLQASGCTAIAYETIVGRDGRLPLLTPMSQVAGRMAVDVGVLLMLKPWGGPGVLLSGVPGVAPGKVVILGGGVSGTEAARIAVGQGADVTIFDIDPHRLAELDARFDGRVKTVFSTHDAILAAARDADLIVGCVLIPGASAPKLISRADLAQLKPGVVLVDVAIDQGGCFETSRPTTHADPTYRVDGVLHYCVANMPGAAARTSTYALNAATQPYVIALADKGVAQAFADDPGFALGLNVQAGKITHPAVEAAVAGQ